ncbi:MAG: proton-conducting transporter membrane subunit [Candidatus Omnitrophota bacterium]
MTYTALTYIIGIPVIAGIVCLAVPDRIKSLARAIAMTATLAALVLSVRIFIHKEEWAGLSSSLFSVDALSAFIGMGVTVFAFLIALYSCGFIAKGVGRYFGWYLLALAGSLGVSFADNLIILLVSWGSLAVVLYLLVNMSATKRAAESARKALIVIGGTDAVMIFGIAVLWAMTGTFSMSKMHIPLNGILPFAAYLSLAIASFAKAGAMPFHSWLPDVAEDGPAPVTAYLPASLDKLLGIYLLARISMNVFIMNDISRGLLLIVGSVTIVLAVIYALVQHDLKRLLGYHAVSQVGYMILGIGTGNPIGIAGGLFHMLNHAIYKSCLFLAGGAVEKETGTTDLDKLGGLAQAMPVTFLAFLVASLSISGIPPFNGFASKWMVYQGIIESACGKGGRLWVLWLTAAMFGSALTVASFMKLVHSVFLGRPSGSLDNIKEAVSAMKLPMVILAALCVVFGIFAFSVPLSILILPAIGARVSYEGLWSPAIATALVGIGVFAGFLIYRLSGRKSFRTVSTFVGGTDQEDLGRISGTEFYDTIRDLKGLGAIYRKEEAKTFDIYEMGRKAVGIFTRMGQYAHNGVLPTYMVWCLLGMVGMFLVLFLR